MVTDRQQALEATVAALQSNDLSATRTRATVRAAAESVLATMDAIEQITSSREWVQLIDIFPGTTIDDLFDALDALGGRYDGDGVPTMTAFFTFWDDLTNALPCIRKALTDKQMTLIDFVAEPVDTTTESPFGLCLKRVQTAPHISAAKVSTLTYPIDKINGTIWQPLSADDRHTDGFFHIDVSRGPKKNTDDNVHILYNVDFREKEEQLDNQLATFSGSIPALNIRTKRTMIACNELYKHSDTFSRTQIYHVLGYTGKPNSQELDKIDADLRLLQSVMRLDNRQEIDAGYRYARIVYEGAMMPHERIIAWIDGILVVDAVHLFRQPPLMAFAEGRNQVAKIPSLLLATNKRKTPGNLSIEDYLIQRIARMKNNDSIRRKILYQTVFEKCGITGRMQKSRVKITILEFLNHYEACGYIIGFTETKNGIIIRL